MAGDSELELIAGIRTRQGGAGSAPPWLVAGIGDDAAQLAPPAPGLLLCVSVDCAVDGIHFRLDECGAAAAAAKAVKAALSDIAAMGGGVAGWVLAGVTLDRRRPAAEREVALESIAATCADHGFTLIGGDITAGEVPTAFSITVGAWSSAPIGRNGAVPGDAVFVSGELGGSLEGHHHLSFAPRLELGALLAADHRPSAMIDVSDGLAPDLLHLCAESGVAATLDEGAIPLRAAAGDDIERALGDGEDYELLFTVSPAVAARIPAELGGVRITRIGCMVAGAPAIELVRGGQRRRLERPTGWDPLRESETADRG